jgi:hypothetical protein
MSEQKVWEYKVEDIFEDIPGDLENINMNIPEEIREAMGVKPGDPVRIFWGDQVTIKIEKITQEEYDENTSE